MNQLPKYTKTSKTEDVGVDIVSLATKKEFGWIFREQPKNDLGIDGQIEIINEKNYGTGRLLAAQIKSGPSYFKHENNDGYTFYGENKHLDYWLNHSLPVIVIICDIENEVCNWVEISRSNISRNKKGWNVTIPKVQTLTLDFINELTAIAGRPNHPDIVEMLLPTFLKEKYHKYSSEGNMDICPLLQEPRDFMYFTHLAELNDKIVYIAHHYDIYKDFSKIELAKFILWRKQNFVPFKESDELPYLFIFNISEEKKKLKTPSSIKKILKNTPNVKYFNLLYSNSHRTDGRRFYSLVEIDDNGDEVYFYM